MLQTCMLLAEVTVHEHYGPQLKQLGWEWGLYEKRKNWLIYLAARPKELKVATIWVVVGTSLKSFILASYIP